MAIEPREGETPPEDVGSAETLPGQEEVVAGTPQHEEVLNKYPNVSSYGPEVNVVLPPEPPAEEGITPVEAKLITDDERGDEPGRE